MNEEKTHFLLVEDDENLGYVLKDYLEMSNYNVHWCKDGEQALRSFIENREKYLLCILDVMLPQKDGFTLAADIRSIDSDVPMIFLTAKSLKEDTIKGLKLGADDYITKPFSTEELLLRIEAILRRYNKTAPQQGEQQEFQIGTFRFDYPNQLLVSPQGEKHLTRKEAEVLFLLCENQNQLVRREIALKKIWGEDDYFMGRSMDVYITKLRKHFKSDNSITITNVHGSGFKLEVK